MTVRSAQAVWNGTLREGDGTVRAESGFVDVPYSFGSRFEEAKGSNPEELIAAAHAGCFSMFVSALLTKEGHPPTRIRTTAKVHLESRSRHPLYWRFTNGRSTPISAASRSGT